MDYETCPACGGICEWVECDAPYCDDGMIGGDALMSEDPLWYDQDDEEVCDQCLGAGGWWECPTCIRQAVQP